MKIINFLALALLSSQTSFAADTAAPVPNIKEMAYALCDIAAADSDNLRKSCQSEASRITEKNFYDIALQLCTGDYGTSTRNIAQCYSDAGEKISILGGSYEAEFSEKIFDCENKEYTEQFTQNDVIGCQKTLFEASAKNFAKGSAKGSNRQGSPKATPPVKSKGVKGKKAV